MSTLLIFALTSIFVPLVLTQEGIYVKYFKVNKKKKLYAIIVIQMPFISI